MSDLPTLAFASRQEWEAWLDAEHERSDGVWLKLAKKGVAGVSYPEAVEVALCYGWIDGQARKLDDMHWLQRYTPRRRASRWSKINRDKAQALIDNAKMQPAGLREVERAKTDGRWDAAYAPQRALTKESIPEDLRIAIEASPKALTTFANLGRQNLFALTFRTNNMKTAAGREKKIAALVAMLARGETIYPERKR